MMTILNPVHIIYWMTIITMIMTIDNAPITQPSCDDDDHDYDNTLL